MRLYLLTVWHLIVMEVKYIVDLIKWSESSIHPDLADNTSKGKLVGCLSYAFLCYFVQWP